MSTEDPLLTLLARFSNEGVQYVLVGGQAVRLNGYLRATEDVDVLVNLTHGNGEKIIRALDFLPSSKDLAADWFVPAADGSIENIRVAAICWSICCFRPMVKPTTDGCRRTKVGFSVLTSLKLRETNHQLRR